MANILVYLIHTVLLTISILGGSVCIYDAIRTFTRKQYFRFGVNTMLAVYFIVTLIKNILGGL